MYCTRQFIGEELILAIGDFLENSPIANINNYGGHAHKAIPLKTKKLEKKDKVARTANIKSTNCFSQKNLPKFTLANKLSYTVCHINLYLYEFYEPILFFSHVHGGHGHSPWFKRKIWPFLKATEKEQNLHH